MVGTNAAVQQSLVFLCSLHGLCIVVCKFLIRFPFCCIMGAEAPVRGYMSMCFHQALENANAFPCWCSDSSGTAKPLAWLGMHLRFLLLLLSMTLFSMDTVAADLEAALLESLAANEGAQGSRPAPPASKAVVQQLSTETLTLQRLQQLGGSEVQCSVCR